MAGAVGGVGRAPGGAPLADLALARTAIDPVGERRKDTAWVAAAWADPRARVVVIHDGRTYVSGDRLAGLRPDLAGDVEPILLGVDGDGAPWFAALSEQPLQDGPERVVAGLREVGDRLDDRDAGLFVQSVALTHWHRTHPHCARCGAATDMDAAGHIRRCPVCQTEHFPRTDPAVIVLVFDDDDRALLGHDPRWPDRRYSTLAGFVEPGESLERAVQREVMEEVGVAVTDVSYLGSQPWPFPASLMVGFKARCQDPSTLRVDGDEISDAAWFTRTELEAAVAAGEVVLPTGLSIARRLIEHWWGGVLPGPAVARW
jgi:NAD+ diphosphatase